jgi:hypothetical protein
MPRLFHKIINNKEKEDLKILIEKLFSYVEKIGGLDHFEKIDKNCLDNIFSYYKKLDDIGQEEINILWESADHFLRKLLNRKSSDVIDTQKRDDEVEEKKLLYGKYWILPSKNGKKRKYVKCDDHVKFCRDNGELFIDSLAIDAFDFLHAVHSGEMNIIPMVLAAGGIMGEFIIENGKKVGRFQLSQCSIPWLKQKLVKMPIFKSHLRIFDPHEEYKSDKDGTYFVFRRPIR